MYLKAECKNNRNGTEITHFEFIPFRANYNSVGVDSCIHWTSTYGDIANNYKENGGSKT